MFFRVVCFLKRAFFGDTIWGIFRFTFLEEAFNFQFQRDIWTGDDFEPEILKAYRNLADYLMHHTRMLPGPRFFCQYTQEIAATNCSCIT